MERDLLRAQLDEAAVAVLDSRDLLGVVETHELTAAGAESETLYRSSFDDFIRRPILER